ncbi:MAG: hypothetical protein ACI81L_001068 [Verrucomicrobiales bacterium]|jgi:hypothetical protein
MSDITPEPTNIETAEEEAPQGRAITDAAKLIRLGTMTQSLMTEAREAPLDDAGRALLAKIHGETMAALEDTMSEDLLDELREFQLCIDCGDELPSEGELRIAQAQLVGWLQGLHQGFQAMAMAQQAAAMQQLQQLQARGGAPQQLPPGAAPVAQGDAIDAASRPGTYL